MSRYADLIAERAGALGGVAQGTVQTAADCSPLRPYPLGVADVTAHVCAVAEVLAAFGASVRGAIEQAAVFEDADAADVFVELPRGDAATADVFAEILRGVDELLWLVESHLQPVAEVSDRQAQAGLEAERGLRKAAGRGFALQPSAG
jgi:starvation-inducible DNA-binding protein